MGSWFEYIIEMDNILLIGCERRYVDKLQPKKIYSVFDCGDKIFFKNDHSDDTIYNFLLMYDYTKLLIYSSNDIESFKTYIEQYLTIQHI